MNQDIETREKAEQTIKEPGEKYRLVVEHASASILFFQDGKITF